MAIAKNTPVRQIVQAPVEGVIAEFCVDQETGIVQYRVEWTCDEGHVHSKWFNDGEIAAI